MKKDSILNIPNPQQPRANSLGFPGLHSNNCVVHIRNQRNGKKGLFFSAIRD